jgi:hypothetical protein
MKIDFLNAAVAGFILLDEQPITYNLVRNYLV